MEHFWFLILIILMVAGQLLDGYIIKYLKVKHIKVWEELGKPGMLFDNSIKSGLIYMSFIWKKKYLKENDSKLTSLCQLSSRFTIFYYFYLIIVPFLFFLKGMNLN
jgi:hypothetical protein